MIHVYVLLGNVTNVWVIGLLKSVKSCGPAMALRTVGSGRLRVPVVAPCVINICAVARTGYDLVIGILHVDVFVLDGRVSHTHQVV